MRAKVVGLIDQVNEFQHPQALNLVFPYQRTIRDPLKCFINNVYLRFKKIQTITNNVQKSILPLRASSGDSNNESSVAYK